MDRQEILNKVLDYAKSQAVEGYEYAYAFGMLSTMLTDEQLQNLEKGLN